MSKKKVKVSKEGEAAEVVGRAIAEGSGAEDPKKKPAQKVPPAPAIPPTPPGKDAYSRGFVEGLDNGYDRGYQAGKEVVKDSIYPLAFADGIRHIVALAEQKMLWEFKSPGVQDREALIKTGKMPIWWIMTLVSDFVDGGGTRTDREISRFDGPSRKESQDEARKR